MMRPVLIAATTIAASVGFMFGFSSDRASATLAAGEFWRLPWAAGVVHNIGEGNGYGEDTHVAQLHWALDLQVPEGNYVVNAQEGEITAIVDQPSCGANLGSGTYVEVEDVNGFVHHYAHLQTHFGWELGDQVLAGWAIGRSGNTGNVNPCVGGAHLHYKVAGCSGGRCIPEPLSNQCADWSYKGYAINCALKGPQYAFSYDPSSGDPTWKENAHESNNAGVGDKPVTQGVAIQNDSPIIERYSEIAQHYNIPGALIVGKPTNPYGGGFYVHRWESFAGSGWVQDFDSPSSSYGAGAIMHGDTVNHNPADGRANIPAAWIYGKFWYEYLGFCEPWGGGAAVQYIHLLGYPTSERYADGFGIARQHFQHGSIWWAPPYNPNEVQLHDLNDERFGPNCDDPLPPPPTPTPTRTPTPRPTQTLTRTPTRTFTPTPTFTPAPAVDTDGDGCTDPEELGSFKEHGGDRDPNYFWDFYDVNGTKDIDVTDGLLILNHFGHGPNQDSLDNTLDRYSPDSNKPYRSAEANDGVDYQDYLSNAASFGHTCAGPP